MAVIVSTSKSVIGRVYVMDQGCCVLADLGGDQPMAVAVQPGDPANDDMTDDYYDPSDVGDLASQEDCMRAALVMAECGFADPLRIITEK